MTTHPFAELCLESELVSGHTLAVEKLFIAPFDIVICALKKFISEERDIDDKLIFLPPVTQGHAARERVNEYSNFVKKNQNKAPIRLGCDDEQTPNKLLQTTNELYKEICCLNWMVRKKISCAK